MKKSTDHIEKYRVRTGPMASDKSYGMNGAFILPVLGETLGVVVSNGDDWDAERLPPPRWEHVSVSHKKRCPTWYEMQAVKEIFWEPTELVVQFHVASADHINLHKNCLHLWRCIDADMPLPPKDCV